MLAGNEIKKENTNLRRTIFPEERLEIFQDKIKIKINILLLKFIDTVASLMECLKTKYSVFCWQPQAAPVSFPWLKQFLHRRPHIATALKGPTMVLGGCFLELLQTTVVERTVPAAMSQNLIVKVTMFGGLINIESKSSFIHSWL
jgi:hypothetical protein